MKKNIIFLLIDSMSDEDLKFIKKNLNYFPGFRYFMSNNSIEFPNSYGASTPTEPTMPTLFTGEFPLNKKTYEYGIKNFRKDFFMTLKNNKFEFFLINNHCVMSKMMGYSKNLIKILIKNSIEHQWKYFQRVYCWSYLNVKDYEKIKVFSFKKKYMQFLNFFEYYITRDSSWFSIKVNNLTPKKAIRIKNKIKNEKKEISKINKNNFEKKIKKIIKYDFFSFFGESSIKDVCLRLLSKFFVDKNTTWKYSRVEFFDYQLRFRNLTTNIDKMLKTSLGYIKKKKENFFLITHIMDLHHLNFSSNNLVLKKPKIKKFKKKHLYGTERELSLIFIDQELKKFIENIPKNILNKSVISVSADHWTASDEKNEGPLTNKSLTGLFSERFLKIPFLIYEPEKRKKKIINKSIVNSANIFPLLFKLANLKLNSYVRKLSKVANQKFVLSEHTHRGPAYENLKNKQIYNCIITDKYKYIKKSKIGLFDQIQHKNIFVNKKKENENLLNKKNFRISKFKKYFQILDKRQKELLN